MSGFIRRLLYVEYWGLVVFAFAYSGYCYFYPKGFSSERPDSVSQARRQVEETSYTSYVSLPSEDALSRTQGALRDVAPFAASHPAAGSQASIQERLLDDESLTVPQPQSTKISNVDLKEERRVEMPMAPSGNLCTIIPSKSSLHSCYVFVAAPRGETPKVCVTSSPRPEKTRHSVSMTSVVATEIKKASVKSHRNIPSDSQLWQLAFLLNEVRQKKNEVLEPTTISIGEIRVGYRTPGTNPEGGDGQDESIFENEPHYVFTLRLAKEDGSLCTARLLRPWRWLLQVPMRERRISDDHEIDAVDVAVDELNPYPWLEPHTIDVWLDLASFGCEGWAEIVEVKRFNDYRPGPGNLVTGTFEHTVDNLVNLCVEGQDKPIGCTPNHPFWSADREEFVEAGELLFGERVTLLNGETKRVLQRLPRPGPEKVYNLEVFGEHVYHVTSDGILVHNDCVYFAFKDGKVAYVGRTNNFPRRAYEQAKYNHREITPVFFLNNLTPDEARVIEDLFIRNFGLQNLDNKINGIAKSKRMRNNFSSIREKWIDSLSQKYNINLEAGAMDEMQREYPSEINDIIKSLLNIP